MENLIIEIRAAEGGADAKDLVFVQLGIYGKRCSRNGWIIEMIESCPGFVCIRVSGNGCRIGFHNESGGMRWQRVPPTERKGRVQTSTVTVAVLPEPTNVELKIDEKDLEWATCRGSGPGGQKRNKTESAVQLRHLPTNTLVRCETERSQHQNRMTALSLLRAKLWDVMRSAAYDARTQSRRQQVGSGMRGDKRRTIRCQDGTVNDHVTGRSWDLKSYLRGEW